MAAVVYSALFHMSQPPDPQSDGPYIIPFEIDNEIKRLGLLPVLSNGNG
jgi:hypothetical protein